MLYDAFGFVKGRALLVKHPLLESILIDNSPPKTESKYEAINIKVRHYTAYIAQQTQATNSSQETRKTNNATKNKSDGNTQKRLKVDELMFSAVLVDRLITEVNVCSRASTWVALVFHLIGPGM